MSLRLQVGALSDVGLVRQGNEDSLYAGPRLLAVADGMGGAAAGEVASSTTITTIATLDSVPDVADPLAALRDAVITANRRLREMTAADAALAGMGTTLTALLWANGRLALAHVGDSRAYLLRGEVLDQLTRDHTFVQMLLDAGRITADQVDTHPQRSVITNVLDGRGDPEPDLSVREVQVGDRYLLCSDGLCSYVGEASIAEALAGGNPQSACERLVDLALRAGGPDNVSCVVADVEAGPEDEADQVTAEIGAPILGGAVLDAPTPAPSPDTAAGRAALLGSDAAGAADAAGADSGDEGTAEQRPAHRRDGPRGIARRLSAVAVVVVVLVVAAVIGTGVYVHHQWYVAPAASAAGSTVAVYQGVQGSALGHPLSHVRSSTDIPVTALPQDDRDKVTSGIGVSGLPDARRAVTALRTDACSVAASQPAPPTASPTASGAAPGAGAATRPTVTASSRSSSVRSQRMHATTAPTTVASPAWCTP